jgi:DMSO/TMAO reductase YedYZ molybdopterin-dependent catalytic subunit
MNAAPVRAVRRLLPDAGRVFVSLLAGVAGVAGSYAVAGFTPSFVVGPIAGTMARQLPSEIITFGIVVLGDAGDQLNVVAAVGIAVVAFGVGALSCSALGRRLDAPPVGILLATAFGVGIAFGLTGAPLSSIASGASIGVVLAVSDLFTGVVDSEVSPARRRVLGGTATALALSVGGFVFGRQGGIRRSDEAAALDVSEPIMAEITTMLDEADDSSLAVTGLEPLVSEEFYEVDINATDPTIDSEAWSLSVTGAVEEEVSYTYDEIRAMDGENRFVSLRCVGEGLNGKKLDNALWTGVPIMDLVDPAVPVEECCVMLRAADGFYEEFPLSALSDGFLAYGMNGDVLPRGHGYPARALIPGHWGEINVKWLTEIEVLEQEQDGYWEERGWHGTGPVNTVAKLHVVNVGEDTIEVAGHAYAGTRGIDRVEVSTDGGDSWSEATLSEPLPGDDVWRQWSYSYDSPGGEHDVVVRATDGEGTLQPKAETDAFPSGPSGWVSRTVRP